MYITNLPLDIYRIINEFVCLNSLLNTTKKLDDIKKELYYWKLNKCYSLQFYECEKFRNDLLLRTQMSNKQIDINLNNCLNINDVSVLRNVHTLNLGECLYIKDVSALGNVHTLDLNSCQNIKDVSALGNVHTLNLSWCRNIKDMSVLENVHTLKLNLRKSILSIEHIKGINKLKNIKWI